MDNSRLVTSFLDVGYLRAHVGQACGTGRSATTLDIGAACRFVRELAGDPCGAVRWYDALPLHPTAQAAVRRELERATDVEANLTVVLGTVVRREHDWLATARRAAIASGADPARYDSLVDPGGVVVQKGVDVALGIDLATTTGPVLLVAGDADLCPAVARAKQDGRNVILVAASNCAWQLRRLADQVIDLTGVQLRSLDVRRSRNALRAIHTPHSPQAGGLSMRRGAAPAWGLARNDE